MALTNTDPLEELPGRLAGEDRWRFLLRLVRLCRGSLPPVAGADPTLLDELRDCLALSELCVLRAMEDVAMAQGGSLDRPD
jgi:hypothetical protein